jgi:hypothetical protein
MDPKLRRMDYNDNIAASISLPRTSQMKRRLPLHGMTVFLIVGFALSGSRRQMTFQSF